MRDWIQPAATTLLLAACQQVWAGAHENGAPGDDPAAGAEKARPCLGCHRNDDFSGFSPAIIAESISAVVAEDRSHPQRLELTDQDIADLAAYLDASSD